MLAFCCFYLVIIVYVFVWLLCELLCFWLFQLWEVVVCIDFVMTCLFMFVKLIGSLCLFVCWYIDDLLDLIVCLFICSSIVFVLLGLRFGYFVLLFWFFGLITV